MRGFLQPTIKNYLIFNEFLGSLKILFFKISKYVDSFNDIFLVWINNFCKS